MKTFLSRSIILSNRRYVSSRNLLGDINKHVYNSRGIWNPVGCKAQRENWTQRSNHRVTVIESVSSETASRRSQKHREREGERERSEIESDREGESVARRTKGAIIRYQVRQ